MRDKGRQAMFGAELQIKGGIRDVAQNGASGGVLPRAPAIKKRVTNNVATNKNGVEYTIYAGEHVRVGDQGRVDRNLNPWTLGLFRFGFTVSHLRSANSDLNDAEKFDSVAKLLGELDVQ